MNTIVHKIDIYKILHQLFGYVYLHIVVPFFFVKHLQKKLKVNVDDESVENMALNCANNYYCTYCEKCVSSNQKCIEDHNNSKPHQRFVKLQENTHLLKRFCIGN